MAAAPAAGRPERRTGACGGTSSPSNIRHAVVSAPIPAFSDALNGGFGAQPGPRPGAAAPGTRSMHHAAAGRTRRLSSSRSQAPNCAAAAAATAAAAAQSLPPPSFAADPVAGPRRCMAAAVHLAIPWHVGGASDAQQRRRGAGGAHRAPLLRPVQTRVRGTGGNLPSPSSPGGHAACVGRVQGLRLGSRRDPSQV